MDIMVAVDPQDPGDEVQQALPWATRLGGRLHLRLVSSSPASATSVLDGLVATIPAANRGEAKQLQGSAGHVLVDEAAGFDLVVVGTHARTGLGRLFLGSVAERVVRMVDGSALVGPRGATPLPSSGPLRVLCPVDAQEPSLRAVTRVRQWLGAEAEIHVVHALADLFASRRVGMIGEISAPEEHPHHAWAKRECQAAVDASGIDVAGVHMILASSSHPAGDLVDFSTKLGAHLLAMPTHGRKGVERLQFGSVTERVIRMSPRPSLVVR